MQSKNELLKEVDQLANKYKGSDDPEVLMVSACLFAIAGSLLDGSIFNLASLVNLHAMERTGTAPQHSGDNVC